MFLSIIIVHYNNKNDLFDCLSSVYKNKPKIEFEIIVVDNSKDKKIFPKIKKEFRQVKYVFSQTNLGYGGGMNLGAKHARGEYLFILNPDTIFNGNTIDKLCRKIKENNKIGIIAPLLYKTNGEIMEQGAKDLAPKSAIFKLSFIDKLFPNNPISKNYWVEDWKKNDLVAVDNVPGSAFIIRGSLFGKLGGFDENFFLYFEEFDLCRRARALGYKIYIDPTAKLVHKWGTSTKYLDNINTIFNRSRFYYFKKHFGILKALFVELFLKLNKYSLTILIILIGGAIFRFYQLSTNVSFIGDQGWFYISARNLILNHQIPLVGITSSHLWLHQGPLWTYVLSVLFLIFNFNPLAPFYFTALLDVFTIFILFVIVKQTFNSKTAMFASLIYALSPLIVLNARTPYHTTLIPLFVLLLFFSIYKWIKGSVSFFPISVFFLFVLYNLELENFILIILFLFIFLWGLVRRTTWFNKTLSTKIVCFSILAFFIPMTPILLYDFQNGFPQTITFAGWVIYKLISFPINLNGFENLTAQYHQMFLYFYTFFQKLLTIKSGVLSLALFCLSLMYLIFINVKFWHKKNENYANILLFSFIIFLVVGILISKTPSDAYLPSLYIPVILMVSIFIMSISKVKYLSMIIILAMIAIMLSNYYDVILNHFYIGNNFGPSLSDRVNASKYIVTSSGNNKFAIIGRGEGSQFASFTMNYQYLTWYYGKESVKKNWKVLYIISESKNGVNVEKNK